MFVLDDYYFYYRKDVKKYFLKLIIPKIEFNKNIYTFDSKLNNVDYNIELLMESSIEDNLYFFAGHTGSGDNCYFNRLIELEVGDIIYILKNDELLIYEIFDMYYIKKNGYMEVDENIKNVIFLITCSGFDRQLIVKGVLIN